MRASARTENIEGEEVVSASICFDEAGLSLLPTALGLVIRLEGCVTAGEPGSPGLPSRILRIALPAAKEATTAEGRPQKTVLVAGKGVLIAPVQHPEVAATTPPRREPREPTDATAAVDPRFLSRHAGTIRRSVLRRPEEPFLRPLGAPRFTPSRPELYERELRAPRPVARLLRTEVIGEAPVAVVELNPVRLVEGQLEFHPEILVTLRCMPQRGRRVLRSRGQARRGNQLASRLVVNPELLPALPESAELDERPPATVDYLIITDDQLWDEAAVRPIARAGDLITPFTRLLSWKQRRGLATKLVTVSEIVSGAYGDFRKDARDLQEVLRGFLKWAHASWGVSFVLLGGDIDIIPVRSVAGGALGNIYLSTVNPPPDNAAYFDGTCLRMNVVNPGDWWPGPSAEHRLIRPDTGQLIPFDKEGTSSPDRCGWYFTDASYDRRSEEPTQFVCVNGPEREINAAMQWIYPWNTLPTDLYYASLVGETYDVPGRHDWDLVDNGIYGQNSWDQDLDGVRYQTDVSVGRAPVSSAEQADTFVNKVLAYEQFRSPSGQLLDLDWPRRMLLVSANFSPSTWLWADKNNPPGPGLYHHEPESDHTLIHLDPIPGDLQWNLIAAISESEVQLVPFDLDAATSGHGWYFARSATDLSPSVDTLAIGILPKRRVPRPTEWVVVYAKPPELMPQHYVFDRATQDTSMAGKEAVRAEVAASSPRIDQISRLYEDEFDLTPEQEAAAPVAHASSERVREALEKAPHFVSLSGHGSSSGCCWLDSRLAQALGNGLTTFIGYADSCFTNQFDVEDAVSEHLLHNPRGGAVAYVGSTRFSWIGVGDDFELAFFQRLPSTCSLGLLADSRCALVNGASGWGVFNKWIAFSLNLIGDPEMPVWIGRPRTLSVRYEAAPRKGRPFTVQVSERLPLGPVRAVPGACVHVQQRDFSASAVTGADGVATLQLAGAARGELTLTISAPGFIPFLDTESVTEPVWLRGQVAAVLHQHGAPDRTLIRLRTSEAGATRERSYLALRSLPDYELIVGAAVSAHLAAKPLLLCVDTAESGGTIERFRLGSWETTLDEIEDGAK